MGYRTKEAQWKAEQDLRRSINPADGLTFCTPDELYHSYGLLMSEKDKLKKHEDWFVGIFVAMIFVAAFAVLGAFKGTKIIATLNSPNLTFEEWSWWGLSSEKTPIEWRDGKWMYYNDRGQWAQIAPDDTEDMNEPLPDPRR